MNAKINGYCVEAFSARAWVSKGYYFASLAKLKITCRLEARDAASGLNVAKADIDVIDAWCKAHGYKPKERRNGIPQVCKERRSARK